MHFQDRHLCCLNFYLLFQWRSTLKGKNLLLLEQFLCPVMKWGGAYNFTLVHMYFHIFVCSSVTLCSGVHVSAIPPAVFDAGI